MAKWIYYSLLLGVAWGYSTESYLKASYKQWASKYNLAAKKKAFVYKIAFYTAEENLKILKARRKVSFLDQKRKGGKSLSSEEKQYLLTLFSHYRVSSISSLKSRMDIIPLSLAIAQAIEESGWGQSASAQKKNACFGLCRKGTCFNYKTLEDGVRAYIDNLNRHYAYAKLRLIRQTLRTHRMPLKGSLLAEGLKPYCTRSSYSKTIRSIIQKYRLERFDKDFIIMGEVFYP